MMREIGELVALNSSLVGALGSVWKMVNACKFSSELVGSDLLSIDSAGL